MKHLLAPLLFFLFFSTPTNAQDTHPVNDLLWDDDEYLALPVYADSTKSGGKTKADLRSWCPTPGDQCDHLSCVGWAIVYAMTIRRSFQCQQKNRAWINAHLLSPAFIYNQVKAGKTCDAGAYLTKGLQLAKDQGSCLFKTMPYECCCCSQLPNKRQQQEAAQYRLVESRRLYGLQDNPGARVQKTMAALDNYDPVIVALLVTPDFKSLAKDDGPWVPNQEALLGGKVEGHALVVVGYDEETRLFTLLNSFGTSWGDGGFVRMSFEDFGQQVRYGVVATIGWVDCGR